MSYLSIITAAERDTRRYCAIELGMTSVESTLWNLLAKAKPGDTIPSSHISLAKKAVHKLRAMERKWRKGERSF